MSHTRPLHRGRLLLVIVALIALVAVTTGVLLLRQTDQGQIAGSGLLWAWQQAMAPAVELTGLDDGVANLEVVESDGAVLVAEEPERVTDADVTIGGQPVDAAFDADGRLPLPLDDLADGEHEVAVSQQGSWREPGIDARWTIEVDTSVPELEVDPVEVAVGDQPLTVSGSADPDAEVTINEEPAELNEGRFEVEVDMSAGSAAEIVARARNAVGNVATVETTAAWVPSRSSVERINSLHVSFHGWADESVREPILELAREGRINSVQLDLKDESGYVGYDTDVDLANEIGANADLFDLDDAIAELHDLGVRVVGRIVAFRDPVHAVHAWEHGDRDVVIQRPEGTKYGHYGGFTSFAHEEVRDYHFALAEEAARAGVDDVLWDYIRRPDGPEEEYYFGGLEEGVTPEESVVEFLAEADEVLAPFQTGHGASVYGIAVTRPTQIAQDIPAMAEVVDYVAPMVYASHWGPGEYGVDDPIRQPYEITKRSLEDFVEAVQDKRARIVPWLQDFSIGGVTYGEQEVRDQLRATADAGLDEWIMWDPSVRYTVEAYDVLDEEPGLEEGSDPDAEGTEPDDDTSD